MKIFHQFMAGNLFGFSECWSFHMTAALSSYVRLKLIICFSPLDQFRYKTSFTISYYCSVCFCREFIFFLKKNGAFGVQMS